MNIKSMLAAPRPPKSILLQQRSRPVISRLSENKVKRHENLSLNIFLNKFTAIDIFPCCSTTERSQNVPRKKKNSRIWTS